MGQRGLISAWARSRSGAWEVAAIAQKERRSSGFSPMTPLGGRAVKMAGRRRSTEAANAAPMGRWFWLRGGEIGAGVGVVENGGALDAFIGAGYGRGGRRWQWNINGAGYGRWKWGRGGDGVRLFPEGEEARWLHGAGGGQHSEERHNNQRGRRRRWLTSGGQRRPKEIGPMG
jgi:hypothetical protein